MQHPPAYVCIERRKRDAQGCSSLAREHVAVARRHNLFPYTLISQSRLTAYRLADDIRKGTANMPLEQQSGLEGVAATTTRLSRVDGEAGRLILAGYAVEKIAPRASFE